MISHINAAVLTLGIVGFSAAGLAGQSLPDWVRTGAGSYARLTASDVVRVRFFNQAGTAAVSFYTLGQRGPVAKGWLTGPGAVQEIRRYVTERPSEWIAVSGIVDPAGGHKEDGDSYALLPRADGILFTTPIEEGTPTGRMTSQGKFLGDVVDSNLLQKLKANLDAGGRPER